MPRGIMISFITGVQKAFIFCGGVSHPELATTFTRSLISKKQSFFQYSTLAASIGTLAASIGTLQPHLQYWSISCLYWYIIRLYGYISRLYGYISLFYWYISRLYWYSYISRLYWYIIAASIGTLQPPLLIHYSLLYLVYQPPLQVHYSSIYWCNTLQPPLQYWFLSVMQRKPLTILGTFLKSLKLAKRVYQGLGGCWFMKKNRSTNVVRNLFKCYGVPSDVSNIHISY